MTHGDNKSINTNDTTGLQFYKPTPTKLLFQVAEHSSNRLL